MTLQRTDPSHKKSNNGSSRRPPSLQTLLNDHPRAVLITGGVVGGLVLFYLVAFLMVGSGVPRGTTVLGVDIGGMSRAAAVTHLDEQLTDRTSRPLALTAGDETFEVDPAEAGLAFDAQATVDAADGRSLNPFRLVGQLFGGQDLEPVSSLDQERLDRTLETIGKKVETKPREGDVTFKDAQAVAVEPRAGRVLDADAAAVTLRSRWLDGEAIELSLRDVTPTVDRAEVDRALEEFGRPAMSGPVTLDVAGRRFTLTTGKIAPHLDMKPDKSGRLVPRLDGKALMADLGDRLDDFQVEPRDATFEISGGKPQVVPGRDGLTIEAKKLSEAVLEALPKSGSDRVAKVALKKTAPEVTTAEAQSMGVVEKVSEYTTSYPYAAYRLTNIHRAADLVDGSLLKPGETFSLNEIVGERTAENGFAKGTIIKDGRFYEDYGGGVSQVATTTYNAAFFAGLKDVQHKPHSFYISRYPEGREATVVWPYVDMKFLNDSGKGIYVTTSYTDSTVTVTLWGTKKYDIRAEKSPRTNVKPFEVVYDDGDKCVPQQGVEGFDVTVTRVFIQGGREVKREDVKTHYQPAAEIHCEKPPAAPSPADEGN